MTLDINMNNSENHPTKIEAQARDWVVKLAADDIDGQQLQAFQAWRTADPAHEQAFQAADRIWQGIASLEHLRSHARLPQAQPGLLSLWRQRVSRYFHQLSNGLNSPIVAGAGVAATLVLCIGVFMWRSTETNISHSVNLATVTTEVKEFVLDDGSKVTLGADSSAIVRYSGTERRIELTRGDALFDVTPNPKRPFIVMTGTTETRVLGTVFAVERRVAGIHVAVKSGKVRVGSPTLKTNINSFEAILLPGQGVAADLNGHVSDIESIDIDSVGAWKDGRLVYENTPLAEIIKGANRYHNAKIILADPAMAKYKLSISFKIDNIDQLIEDLTEALPLDANRDKPGTIILVPRPETN